jgi:hypothetical protein
MKNAMVLNRDSRLTSDWNLSPIAQTRDPLPTVEAGVVEPSRSYADHGPAYRYDWKSRPVRGSRLSRKIERELGRTK